MGLIAGLQLQDINRMRPGAVIDLYIYRRNYDDAHVPNVIRMW